ncbi:MAG: uroporphyrinogen decarboxylase family protein [Candidatus Latescibacterota bacterium]
MASFPDSLRATLRFERPAQVCHFEWGYWPETLKRWQREGMRGPNPWDDLPITHYERVPVQVRLFPPFAWQVLEEREATRVVQDGNGVVQEVSRHGTAMPCFLRHPVSNLRDFEVLRERLDPRDPGRFPADWTAQAVRLAAREHVLVMGGTEISFFGWARDLLGVENLLLAFHDQPELVHAINRHQLYFVRELYAKVLQDVSFDFVFCWEDMSYRNGPLIGPEMVRRFMLPYYRELVDFFRLRGDCRFLLDSDGDVRQLIPLFREAGIGGFLPFEVAAGMDVAEIGRQYPDLILAGGLDKREIAKGRRAIDRELEGRLPALFRRGGYLPSMDHHVPPDVSWDDFRYYVDRVQTLYARYGQG